jgi:hypothetical protein
MKLNFRNAYYHSVQNHLSSALLSKIINITIYQTIMLPVVLYGYESWSLTLREEYRLRVFENRELRRKLHNEEFRNLYSSPSIIMIIRSRRMRWAGHAARMESRRMSAGYW